jgi:hypothetical protein
MKAIYMAKIKMAAAVIAGVAVIARTSADPQPAATTTRTTSTTSSLASGFAPPPQVSRELKQDKGRTWRVATVRSVRPPHT